jgi:hypothetical protein
MIVVRFYCVVLLPPPESPKSSSLEELEKSQIQRHRRKDGLTLGIPKDRIPNANHLGGSLVSHRLDLNDDLDRCA